MCGIGGELWFGIVYCIDKDIFGLLVVVKDDVIMVVFGVVFKVYDIWCVYDVLVVGKLLVVVGCIEMLYGCDLCDCKKFFIKVKMGRKVIIEWCVVELLVGVVCIEVWLYIGWIY